MTHVTNYIQVLFPITKCKKTIILSQTLKMTHVTSHIFDLNPELNSNHDFDSNPEADSDHEDDSYI